MSAVFGSTIMSVSCDQFFGSHDRYMSPQLVVLKWARLKHNPATGKRDLPEGYECHPCEAGAMIRCVFYVEKYCQRLFDF
jgi:hypothetical protein